MADVIKFYIFVFFHLISIIGAQENCSTIENEVGECRPIHSCKTMLEVFDKLPQPLPSTVRKYLKTYQCASENKDVRVCCQTKPIYFDEYAEDDYFNLLPEPPIVSHHKNIDLLPKDCGYYDSTDRVFGGNQTGLFEFPWMAALIYKTGDFFEITCGGTIINSRYILTAAHCIRDNLVSVRVGDHDIRTTTDCHTDKDGKKTCAPPFQELQIEEVISYPKYNPRNQHHDIAILRVSPINVSLENAKPVCLPLEENRNYNFTNTNVIVTGWGATENRKPPNPVLLKVDLPIVPLETCKDLYSKMNLTVSLYERHLCAGGKKGKDACYGDSGGPLHSVAYQKDDLRIIQQGIVSSGAKQCGTATLPGIYLRVAYFMDWILDNMKP